MALTTEEVRKIASLARLRFSPEEERTFVDQLGKIVDYIDQLQGMETADGDAGPAPGLQEADDLPQACLPRERFLANAPAFLDAFLLVPEVKGGGDGA